MLPHDVLEMVFLLLPPEDRKASMLVCKSWTKVGELSKFWDWVCLKVTEENLVEMSQVLGSKRLKSVKKICLMAVSKELLLAIEKHPGLKVLEAYSCNMPHIHPRLLARVVAQLEEVDLSNTKLTIQQCQEIFRFAAGDSKLKKLSGVRNCDVDPVTYACAVAKLEDLVVDGGLTPQLSEAIFRCASSDSNRKKLSMHGCNLSSVDPEALAAVVAKLEDFKLIETEPSTQQGQAIFRWAAGDSKLKKLHMVGRDCAIRCNLSSVDPEILATVVAKLEDVNFSEKSLTTQQCQAIFRFAAGDSKLKKLGLCSSNLSSVDPETLAVAVSELEDVDLIDTYLTTQQSKAIFRCASGDSKLKKMNLRFCVLSSVDPETLAGVVAKLEDVNLSYTGLTTQQCQAIFRCAAGDTKLKKLSMRYCNMSVVDNSKSDFSTVDPEILARAVAKIEDVALYGVKLTDLQSQAIIAVSGVARLEKLIKTVVCEFFKGRL